jgi:hypothetical protein
MTGKEIMDKRTDKSSTRPKASSEKQKDGILGSLSFPKATVAAQQRLFLAFVDADGVHKHLCLEEPQRHSKKWGFWLRLAPCCARIAGLFAVHAFAGLAGSSNCYPEATEWPKKLALVGGCCSFLGSPRGLSSPSHSPHFPLLP